MPGPVVERGERVTFRTVERDDAQFWQHAGTDPRVRFLLGMRRAYNAEESRERIENVTESDATLGYVVCVEDDGSPGHPGEDETTPIGMVHAYNVDGTRAYLAYWLLPEHHGEGYGKAAAELLVDTVFESCSVHSVAAGAFEHNDESRGLLESLGFTLEWCQREASFVDGEYRDAVEYGLLRREWAAE